MTDKSMHIFNQMCLVMRDVSHIEKDKKNIKQNFKYRGIDDVYNMLHAIMAKHGIFMTLDIIDSKREERRTQAGGVLAFSIITIKYTFWADDGSSVSTTVIGEGMDAGDKSTNKAMSVAQKYALLQTFLIPTDEQKDPDAESHSVLPKTKGNSNQKELIDKKIDLIKTGKELNLVEVMTKECKGKPVNEQIEIMENIIHDHNLNNAESKLEINL